MIRKKARNYNRNRTGNETESSKRLVNLILIVNSIHSLTFSHALSNSLVSFPHLSLSDHVKLQKRRMKDDLRRRAEERGKDFDEESKKHET